MIMMSAVQRAASALIAEEWFAEGANITPSCAGTSTKPSMRAAQAVASICARSSRVWWLTRMRMRPGCAAVRSRFATR